MTADPVSRLAAEAVVHRTACGDGELFLRQWSGPAGAPRVLLVHGGSGSWTHWLRNIDELRQHFTVLAVDLPGLGDSGRLPDGYTASDAVAAVSYGLAPHLAKGPLHIAAFSWGCAVSSQLSARHLDAIRSLLLVGPASLGDIPRRGGMKPLIRRTPSMSEAEVRAANRENLARLMFADRDRIDELAVTLQTDNTRRARFNSPQFARMTLTLDGVAATRIPLKVVYGLQDAPALPDVAGKAEIIRGVRPDAEIHLEPDCGHWLQYEKPDLFNSLLEDWITRND